MVVAAGGGSCRRQRSAPGGGVEPISQCQSVVSRGYMVDEPRPPDVRLQCIIGIYRRHLQLGARCAQKKPGNCQLELPTFVNCIELQYLNSSDGCIGNTDASADILKRCTPDANHAPLTHMCLSLLRYVGRRRRQHLRDPSGLADPAIGRELVVDLARDPLQLLLGQPVTDAPRCDPRDEPAYVDRHPVRDLGGGHQPPW